MKKLSPETNADLVRLRHAQGLEFDDAVGRLAERGEALDKVVQIVESKIDGGTYVLLDKLSELIARTKSASLYAKCRKQLFADDWSLLRLYKARYPDPEIESRLIDRLYEVAGNDAEPRRRYIVEAVRDVGTSNTVPTLEAILFDHVPTLKAKQELARAMGEAGVEGLESWLRNAEVGARRSFLEVVRDAIAAIQARGDTGTVETAGGAPSPEDAVEIRNAENMLVEARRHLEAAPMLSIMALRQGAEALGKHLYRSLGRERAGKSASKMMLGELIKQTENSPVPDIFKICLQTIHKFGNFASHDQDPQSGQVSKEIAESVLGLYVQALDIYRNWLKKQG